MTEFTFLFRGRRQAESPEETQKTIQSWVAWFKELGDQGCVKDPGNPFEPTGKVVAGKQRVINDGPYAEAKDLIGGYTVVEARDLDHAAELSKGCPILDIGGSVEIRPVQPFGG